VFRWSITFTQLDRTLKPKNLTETWKTKKPKNIKSKKKFFKNLGFLQPWPTRPATATSTARTAYYVINDRPHLITHFVTQCGITIFIFSPPYHFYYYFIGFGGGRVWPLNWKYGESLTLTVFSLTHKRKGPRVSDSLKKFLDGDTGPTHSMTKADEKFWENFQDTHI